MPHVPQDQPMNEPAPEPTGIHVSWDPETQTTRTVFNPREFKTWDFVILTLEMAKREAEQQLRMLHAKQMVMLQQEAMAQQTIRNNLGRR